MELDILQKKVIPANAGVILELFICLKLVNGYPRECGGDPIFENHGKDKTELSPRMRG